MLWFCDQYVYSGIREVFCTPGYFLVSCSTLQFWLHHHYCCYFSTSCALRITPHCHSEPKKLTADTSLTNKKMKSEDIRYCSAISSNIHTSRWVILCLFVLSQPQFPSVQSSCGGYFPLCTSHTWFLGTVSTSLCSWGGSLFVLVGPRFFALFEVGTFRKYNGKLHMLFIFVSSRDVCTLNAENITSLRRGHLLIWRQLLSRWAVQCSWVGCTQWCCKKKGPGKLYTWH